MGLEIKKSKIFWASDLEEAGTCQDTGSFMPTKLGNPLSLFINVKKWTG